MGFLDSGRAMADRFEFRPRTGLAACGVWVLLAAIWLLLDMRTGLAAAARDLPVIGAISTIVYALFWRPKVVVGRDEVLLRNVFRDASVPYPDLRRVHTQYVLALETHSGRRFQAWAAPAGGRWGAARVTEADRRALDWSSEELPASAGLRSDAGAVAAAIRRRWQVVCPEAATASGVEPIESRLPGADRGVRVQWAAGVLAVLATCLALSVVVLLL